MIVITKAPAPISTASPSQRSAARARGSVRVARYCSATQTAMAASASATGNWNPRAGVGNSRSWFAPHQISSAMPGRNCQRDGTRRTG